MGALRPPGPAGQLRHRVAIAGEARQPDLQRRARHRDNHLHHAERHGPDQQVKVCGVIHRHVRCLFLVT
jgi:hypothetical protein